MINKNQQSSDVYSENDPLDINELASLNDDISPEFIEQLQNKVSLNAQEFTGRPVSPDKEDSELFEEVKDLSNSTFDRKNFEENIDDNFIKKYKAKLNKQKIVEVDSTKEENKEAIKEKEEAQSTSVSENITSEPTPEISVSTTVKQEESITAEEATNELKKSIPEDVSKNKTTKKRNIEAEDTKDIENITNGNIIEKPLEKELVNYNESLDYLDDNVKYSKYVIYINPENKEFIDSLTVKERKNLINRIIREQDDISITRKRLGLIQTIIKHSIVAIITIAIAIPVTYWAINASLEASINNYRRSQTIFKTLYKEKGKIRTQNNY